MPNYDKKSMISAKTLNIWDLNPSRNILIFSIRFFSKRLLTLATALTLNLLSTINIIIQIKFYYFYGT